MRIRARACLGTVAVLAAATLTLSGCSATEMAFEDFNREWRGISAEITTYDQQGNLIDKIHGKSIQVSLDERFKETSVNSDGTVNTKPGDVLLITIGKSTMSHVGSTMLWAEDGLEPIAGADTTLDFSNDEQGTPWLNRLHEYHTNLWKGKAKTIMIRSQDGIPIAVFAANQVEITGTAVPKSTMYRLDGKRLLVYRADYTSVDTALLEGTQ